MKIIEFPGIMFLNNVQHHKEIKTQILDSIQSMGSFSYKKHLDIISNTDWHLNVNFPRPYYEIVKPIFCEHVEKIKSLLNYRHLEITNYWFQQYHKNDFHGWHTHGKCLFSNVYYVALTDNNPVTTFKHGNTEFNIAVKEGDILTFPSFLTHCSSINKEDSVKTVISFNLDGNY